MRHLGTWKRFVRRLNSNCYNYLNMTKLADKAGINSSLIRQYKRGQYVSEKQASKIQEAVQKIGRELLAMRLV